MSELEFAGQPIVEGDVMDDLNDGPVMVIELTTTNIICRVMGDRQKRVSYNFKGVQARRKRRSLFWHYPITDEPLKNPLQWELQKQFAKDTSQAFRRYVKNGAFVPPALSVVQD